MKAVVMEVRFRVCATPRRAQRFIDHAAHVVASALPKHVQRDQILQQSHSVLLHRQWERLNGESPFRPPEALDIGFGFCDPSGRLTTPQADSIANDALADLAPPPPGDTTTERVPWILTVNTAIDDVSRAAITEQYQSLDAGLPQTRHLVTALPGRAHTYK